MNNYPLINSETHFDMLIVANGSYPENEVGQTIIRHARHLIACDGAAYHSLTTAFVPGK